MSSNMNKLPRLETLMFNKSVIEDVIANMSNAFQDAGVDESVLQKLKQVWGSKMQKALGVNIIDSIPNSTDTGPTMDTDNIKKNAMDETVSVQEAPTKVTTAVAVTSEIPTAIPWKLQKIDLPELLNTYQARRNSMSVGYAMELDGLPPAKEEPDKEEVKVQLELPEKEEEEAIQQVRNDDEARNSSDDVASDGDLFQSDNVIICQFNNITHYRQRWRFNLRNGVMRINGSEYVFKNLQGEADC
ncbi:transcription initiation factor IIA subunit 1-like [Drosophila serrata]|uniref:transcription initiation factor IIA subunit 1-like n=1 Tax=Drosophila serrata TaxID=7274 RepID=UPI000A1D2566|nr:transcription initiation factor IIA subunit 1-like [Drosophila serrata]